MLQKIILFTLLLLLCNVIGSAQPLSELPDSVEAFPDPAVFKGSFYIMSGLPGTEIMLEKGYDNLDKILKNAQIGSETLRNSYSWGIGGRWQRLYAEFLVATSFDDTHLDGNDRFMTSTNHFSGIFQLGYAVWQNRNNVVLVRAGIGGVKERRYIVQTSGDAILDFNNFDQPNSTVAWALEHNNTIGDISIGWIEGRPKRSVSLAESLRLGYRFGLNDKAWEAPGARNIPSDRVEQWYVSFHFQLGYNKKSKKVSQ
ncbi:MAG: hypothetical protein ACK4TA_19060 [Saprospiraceae bacterium]